MQMQNILSSLKTNLLVMSREKLTKIGGRQGATPSG